MELTEEEAGMTFTDAPVFDGGPRASRLAGEAGR
jgi:hypothetical protein